VRASLVTLLPTRALAPRKFALTGLVGLPLPSLVLLDFGICYGLFLLERFAQQRVLHPFLLQLDLMIIGDTGDSRSSFFGEPGSITRSQS